MTMTQTHLCTLSTNAASQLDVFRHDGDTLGVNGAQVGVLKQTHQVGLAGFLKHITKPNIKTNLANPYEYMNKK
jgi:hypothetical protein